MRKSKAERLAEARRELQRTLVRTGYQARKHKPQMLSLERTVQSGPPLSDCIPGNGTRKSTQRYTGVEISGVTLLHKQGYEPVRRDNPQAAIDAAHMRRS